MKKVILFIVEGMSEKNALEPILSVLIDKNKVYFAIVRGDLTTSNDVEFQNKNIKQRVNVILDNFLAKNKYLKGKINKIVLICDTDGCFIPNENIYESMNDIKTRYENDGIYTNCVDNIISRNNMKSRNMNIIFSASSIRNIPIETYYFSSNLDHVLHNDANLNQEFKEDYADEFADELQDHEEDFIDIISDKKLCPYNEYHLSWEFIKKELNSLHRHSNLLSFFMNNYEIVNECVKEKINNI